ncbi:MAG: hypothetical protein A2809_01195 [Candidatus Muproteobacteria bacterium RIFCSPHIGHO2_01_FULL_61_200]|nr:MAG: hypothetical protein A2809_01195 [Candidatus Muproteobacteria bacterium RIFCSPHIGHO2_01_FULL_61_200]
MEFPASAEPEITILKFILPFAVFLMGTTGEFSSAKKIAENQKEIPIYMIICRTILSGTKLDALQRARRVRARDGAHQRRKEHKDSSGFMFLSFSLRPSRLSGKRYYLKAF